MTILNALYLNNQWFYEVDLTLNLILENSHALSYFGADFHRSWIQ